VNDFAGQKFYEKAVWHALSAGLRWRLLCTAEYFAATPDFPVQASDHRHSGRTLAGRETDTDKRWSWAEKRE